MSYSPRPNLFFREGNPNQLRLIITGASLVVPTATLSIILEIRYQQEEDAFISLPFQLANAQTGELVVRLPDLSVRGYYLSLLFDYQGTDIDSRMGLAMLGIIPEGSLDETSSDSIYQITVNQANQLIAVTLDNSPSAQLAAQSAAQAQAARDQVLAIVAQLNPDLVTGGGRVVGETPVGLMNGSNALFTSQHAFVPETVEVFLNGLRQQLIVDYQTSSQHTITLVVAPFPTESILINYTKA